MSEFFLAKWIYVIVIAGSAPAITAVDTEAKCEKQLMRELYALEMKNVTSTGACYLKAKSE